MKTDEELLQAINVVLDRMPSERMPLAVVQAFVSREVNVTPKEWKPVNDRVAYLVRTNVGKKDSERPFGSVKHTPDQEYDYTETHFFAWRNQPIG